jgi:hypothetical protein
MLEASFKDSIHSKKKKSCVLMTVISLDNPLQKGEYWNEFLKLVDRCFTAEELEKLIIVTTGHLQRHYLPLKLEKPEEKTEEMDSQWLEQQCKNLKKFSIPFEIIRWQTLLKNPCSGKFKTFDEFLEKIKDDYNKITEFTNLVNTHVDGYVRRKILDYCKENDKLDPKHFRQMGINYILEESAALGPLFQCGADFLTYPHSINPPANYVWKKYFHNEPMDYVRYEIKKKEINLIPSSISKNSLFKAKDLPSSYSSEYVNWALKKENWSSTQHYQFIKGAERLIYDINSSSSHSETLKETTKIIRRNSL